MPMTGELVLVVDDVAERRNELVRHLEAAGVVTQEATSCDEAISLLESAPVPLVFADADLREKSGYYLLRRIKELHPEVEVVLLAQNVTSYNLLQAPRQGAFDFIVRPLDTGEILQPTLNRAAKYLALSHRNARTVLELEQKTRALERALDTMKALNASMERLTALLEVDALLQELLLSATSILGAACGFIALIERESGDIGVKVGQGYPHPLDKAPLEPGLTTEIVRKGRPLLIPAALPQEVARQLNERERVLFPAPGVLAVPLRLRGREIGLVVLCGHPAEHPFTADELSFLEQLSHHTALVLEHSGIILSLKRGAS